VTEVRHSVQARADLKRIWRFVAFDNEPAVDRLLLMIEERIAQLATSPQSPARDDIRPGFRMMVASGYRVIYEFSPSNDAVEIIAVVEPYRDIEELF
jgi:toxin ParE1/3/4